MVGVERILEYSNLPNEAEWEIESTKPPKGWPTKGVVNFEKYATRYRPGLDLVLKGITVSIEQGEKVYWIQKYLLKNSFNFYLLYILDWNCWSYRGGQVITDIGSFPFD